MTLPLNTPYDLSAVEQFLSSNASLPSSQQHDQVGIVGDETAGMSFSELFSHYLAPEVAKLPNSSNSNSGLPFSDSSFTFGASGGGAISGHSTDANFDPSTFMPNIPGSPISPSENGSLSHSAASPMSFADFDDMFNGQTDATSTSNDAFAVDPSIFDQIPTTFPPPSTAQSLTGISLPSLDQPQFSTALPPLPDVPSLSAYDLPLPPPPAHQNYPSLESAQPALTASGRPKRNVASMVIEEEEEEEEDVKEAEEEEEDEGMSDQSELTTTARRRSSRPPSTKKTRSTSAGPSKKLPKTSVLPLASEGLYKTSTKSNLPPVPLWKDKPDEEEYKKLSSKEKRQLRNKISARNFRHRRKEYITTLEEEISTRDTLISNLQDQVSTLRTDNSSLKSEVTLLKTKWQELLDKMSSLAGSAPAPATSASTGVGLGVNASKALAGGAGQVQVKEEEENWELDSPASTASPLPSTSTDTTTTRRTRSSNGIQKPNLSKDLPPRRSNSSWNPHGFGGGYQSVHTTLVPDFSSLASHLTNKASFNLPNQSFNPNLNNLTSEQLNELPSLTSHLRSTPTTSNNTSAFQDLFSTNPFYLNHASLESQRAGLYSRIAHNTAGVAQAKKQQSSSSSPDGQLPLPVGFRPAFFSSSSSSIPSKSTEKTLPASSSTTTQELLAFQSPSSAPAPPSHQDAYQLKLAQMASETLLSKMTSAFFNAFSGGAPSSSSSWDNDKVKDVISGRATLQVVPVSSTSEKKGLEALEERMKGLDLSKKSSPQSTRARSLSPSAFGGARRSCSFDEVVSRWTIKSDGDAKK
ncbi:bZIP transcription factor [Sporobolomyces salmoneus]|uniref:bZIP transcription factor n=1 Tax=Sporobolomyces salmoneus TaxID=183962 RepID=UPI003176439B